MKSPRRVTRSLPQCLNKAKVCLAQRILPCLIDLSAKGRTESGKSASMIFMRLQAAKNSHNINQQCLRPHLSPFLLTSVQVLRQHLGVAGEPKF